MNVLSLFDGMSCGRIALERLWLKPTKYYASELDKYAMKVSGENYPDIIQLGDVCNWREWNIDWSSIDLLIGGSPCFTGDTKVLTNEGMKSIKCLTEGNLVHTHKGNWKKILKIGGKITDTVIVKAQGVLETETTKNHPYYVRTMTRVWNNDKRTSERSFSLPTWKPAGKLTKSDFIGIKRIRESVNTLKLTNDECFVLGRYIADGHTRKDFRVSEGRPNDRQWQLILSIGNKKHFDTQIPHSIYPHTENVERMVFSSKRLVEIAESECLSGSENKRLSPKLLSLSNYKLEKVIDGILSGDGSIRGCEYRLTTVSLELAQTLCLAVAKVYGVCASIEFTKRPEKTVIQGRTVNQKDTYTVSFRKDVKKQSKFFTDDDFVWCPVKSVTETGCVKDVYNIEVEGDNSYSANNATVHNCQGFSFAGKQLAFDDPRSKLFFVYIDILNHIKSVNPDIKFMLENVKMKREFLDVITENLGVDCVFINSSLVSAQNRQRYYWCNWKVEQPVDREIMLVDILEDDIDDSFYHTDKAIEYMNRSVKGGRNHWDFAHHSTTENDKSACVTANYHKGVPYNMLIDIRCGQMVGHTFNRKDGVGKKLDKAHSISASDYRGLNRNQNQTCVVESGVKYRKLTPIECERLQGVLQYIKPVEIVLCLDQAKSFVSAVEKNPKLLKLVSSAGSEELKECVKLASQNMNANQALKKLTVHPGVGMQTQTQTKKCTKANQDAQSLTASNAEDITTFRQVESAENSVIQSVFINITEGKITHFGREESPQIGQSYTEQMNGKIALKLSGKETMQNASDALSALETMQTNSHSTSITSFRLSTKNLEQMLIISYWFAKNATGGFTQDTISKKALYLNLIDGYTNHVSNTQRYKMLGNGWNVDTIVEILRQGL